MPIQGIEIAPNRKAEIARLEIAFFQMLEGAFGVKFAMSGQMHFAILTDDLAVSTRQELRVEMTAFGGALGVAKGEGNAMGGSPVEEGLGRGVRHLMLEPGVHIGLILHVPAGGRRW